MRLWPLIVTNISTKRFSCGADGRCASVGLGGMCSQSADCPPGQYCNLGYCANYKQIGSPCYNRNECGRVATCLFTNPLSTVGICKQYMKVDSKSSFSVSMKIGSYTTVNDDSHLLCRSQYSDPNGNCSDGQVSVNKGYPCNLTVPSCPSADGSTQAECNCGWNPNG